MTTKTILLNGNPVYTRDNGPRVSRQLAMLFGRHFQEYGARMHPASDLTSGSDQSVRFIGSHISVLKPYMLEDKLPEHGVYIVQKCIRTHGLATLMDETAPFKWGSLFLSLGALVPYAELGRLVDHTLGFLTNALAVPKDHILLRINSGDTDLLASIQASSIKVETELDTMHDGYYKHKIGENTISGRNFNLALRQVENERFADIGNIIVLEKDGVPMFVELALGVSTTLKEIFGLSHVLDCHPVPDMGLPDSICRRRFEDCVMFVMETYHEGLRPSNKHNRNRILKKYMQGLRHYADRLALSQTAVHEALVHYQMHEFGTGHPTAQTVFEDLIKL